MPLPQSLLGKLDIPAVAAPMFLASGTELVIQACRSGVLGAFPALNARTSEEFEAWLEEIEKNLANHERATGKPPAPYGVNLIVNKTNQRVDADLKICIKHKVPVVITSLGAVGELIDAVHSYGGVVFHDVIKIRHAKKAAGAGVDGLIAVCAGAGGHAGTMSPFSLIPEIREFFDKTIILSGCISNGAQIAAAQALGADLAYLGTRFICTTERSIDRDKSASGSKNASNLCRCQFSFPLRGPSLGISVCDRSSAAWPRKPMKNNGRKTATLPASHCY